ncbi:MAG TPA: DMT family transporter [Mycobacteriales bacterium]|nr:DMT family transporter [Mycobacteriales bacterium]
MFVLVALASAFCFAAAVVLQQRSAAEHGARWNLLLRGVWIVGGAVDLAGFLLQATALHFGGVVAVQALLTTVLPFGMVLGRIRPGAGGWLGAGLLAVGLAGLLLALDPRPGTPREGGLRLAVVAVTILAFISWRRGGAVAQSLGAALLFALTATLAATVGDQLVRDGWLDLLAHPELYLLILASTFGLVLEQRAFAAGPLAPSLVALTLADPVASVVLGTTVAGDRLRGGGFAAAAAISAMVATAGVILLARAHREPAPDLV